MDDHKPTEPKTKNKKSIDTAKVEQKMPPTKTFKVEYKYSACIKICTQDISILCDPWFSDEAYYGTWARQPEHSVTQEFIGDYDGIWISHIHPDHYCRATIRDLQRLSGTKPLYITDRQDKRDYLHLKMKADGFEPLIRKVDEIRIGSTCIKCMPIQTGSESDIDSLLIVSDLETKKAVVNLNDCKLTEETAERVNAYLIENELAVELLCLSYTGAGPYPQTYYSVANDSERLKALSEKKKIDFFTRYTNATKMISSRWRLPFAGKYVLAGELSILNPYRGVSDALEVKGFDKDCIVPDDSGNSGIDILNGIIGPERSSPYPTGACGERSFQWRQWIHFEPDDGLLRRLLRSAIERAHKKSECTKDYVYSFYTYSTEVEYKDVNASPEAYSTHIGSCNCNRDKNPHQETDKAIVRTSIFIDKKAFFAVLTGVCHWNNLEVGSAFICRRVPDTYSREMQSFLNFLCAC